MLQQVEGILPRGNDTVIGALAPGADDGEPSGEAGGNLAVALALAVAGVFVFPVQGAPEGDDAKKPFKRFAWRHESTTDAARIMRWWATWPDAAPAIDVGKSGFLVIDCDPAKSDDQVPGEVWWRDRLEEQDTLAIPIVNSPSGGRHYYFRQREGSIRGNGRGSLPPKPEVGVDVRGDGGFVIAPGALLSGGREYVAEGSITDAPVAPEWLVDLLAPRGAPIASDAPVTLPAVPMRAPSSDRARAWATAALDDEFREVASLPPGSRNEGLNKAAFKVGGLVGAGYLSHGEAYDLMRGAVAGWTDQPKTLGTLKRGLADGARAPRIMPPEEGHQGAALAAGIIAGARKQSSGSPDTDPDTGEVFEEEDFEDGPEAGLTLFEGLPAIHDLKALFSLPGMRDAPSHVRRRWPTSDVWEHRPPGLVGDIAEWVYQTARRPLAQHALAVGLAVCGTAMGRRAGGPTGSSTTLYVVGLGETGAGKEHGLDACRRLLHEAGMLNHLGGSEFMSMPAVINATQDQPLSLWPMDEFGALLTRINAKNANGFEKGISKILRSLWGSNFGVYTTPEWAGRKASAIVSPALSIFGVSNPDEFLSALSAADVTNGLLNRLLVVSSDKPKDRQPPICKNDGVPDTIVEGLRWLHDGDARTGSGRGVDIGLQPHRADAEPEGRYFLEWGDGAESIYKHLLDRIELRASDAEAAKLLGRTAEMAVRIATIVAAGRRSGTVDLADMIFGAEVALRSANEMIKAYREGAGHGEYAGFVKLVENTVRSAKDGKIARRQLDRLLRYKVEPRPRQGIINDLVSAGVLAHCDMRPAGAKGRPSPGLRFVASSGAK